VAKCVFEKGRPSELTSLAAPTNAALLSGLLSIRKILSELKACQPIPSVIAGDVLHGDATGFT
jgi:hypothetical protein